MEGEGNSLFGSTMFVGIFAGAIIFLLTYILKLFNNEQTVEDQQKNEKGAQHSEKKKETSSKTKKKVSETKWSNKADKQGFTHPWLIKSLKGHTGEVLDIDFSSNNKYLISCADEDPGGSTESSISSVESAKESSDPPSVEPSPKSKGLSRRQRKNRRKEDTSPESKRRPKSSKPTTKLATKKPMTTTPLKMWIKLNVPEYMLYLLLNRWALKPATMNNMGYPMLKDKKNGEVLIYKASHRPRGNNQFDVNAKEFVPKRYHEEYDSGQGSGNSSDSGENADENEMVYYHHTKSRTVTMCADKFMKTVQITDNSALQFQVPLSSCPPGTTVETTSVDFIDQADGSALLLLTAICVPDSQPRAPPPRRTHTCVRCREPFMVIREVYASKTTCCYHWGKLHRSHNGMFVYTCCHLASGAPGCVESKYHVWNGVEDGANHFIGYVETKPKRAPPHDGNYGIYALDCEMSYTIEGLELTKVTVVGVDDHIVYDSFVKPERDVLDYNTRFSGITSKDLLGAKSLKEVQNDLMGFINANTILIGHGLENDLRALKMVHRKVVDTAHAFPHHLGLPYRRSLKQLAWYVLKREIQCEKHCSYEDAVTSMHLILSLVTKTVPCG